MYALRDAELGIKKSINDYAAKKLSFYQYSANHLWTCKIE